MSAAVLQSAQSICLRQINPSIVSRHKVLSRVAVEIFFLYILYAAFCKMYQKWKEMPDS